MYVYIYIYIYTHKYAKINYITTKQTTRPEPFSLLLPDIIISCRYMCVHVYIYIYIMICHAMLCYVM